MPKKVLLVEDNQDLRDSLQLFLKEDSYSVIAVGNAEDGIDAVNEHKIDIAIIDINLPGKSGFNLIEYIRSEGHTYPLIAMTARDAIVDKVKGFDLGLTDYIVKPFDLLEMRARINAHTRNSISSDVITTKNYRLDKKAFDFSAYGKKIEITTLEMRLLEILMKNNHVLVEVDDIIEHVWGDQPDIISPPVRIHIANLRKKLHDSDFQILRTIPGVGYIFNDPIES